VREIPRLQRGHLERILGLSDTAQRFSLHAVGMPAVQRIVHELCVGGARYKSMMGPRHRLPSAFALVLSLSINSSPAGAAVASVA
jgi:hypothetical protein